MIITHLMTIVTHSELEHIKIVREISLRYIAGEDITNGFDSSAATQCNAILRSNAILLYWAS